MIRNDFGDSIVVVVANLRYKFREPGRNLVVKRLRHDGEERPLILGEAVRDRWRTHQISDCLGNATDKLDFGTKIFLVGGAIFQWWGRKTIIAR
jgi:hypothetical protein